MSEFNIIMTGNTACGDIIGTTSSGVKPAKVNDLFNHILNAPDNVTLKEVCDWVSDMKNVCAHGCRNRLPQHAVVSWYLPDFMYYGVQKGDLLEKTLKFLESKRFPLHGTLRVGKYDEYCLIWEYCPEICSNRSRLNKVQYSDGNHGV